MEYRHRGSAGPVVVAIIVLVGFSAIKNKTRGVFASEFNRPTHSHGTYTAEDINYGFFFHAHKHLSTTHSDFTRQIKMLADCRT